MDIPKTGIICNYSYYYIEDFGNKGFNEQLYTNF